MVLVVAGGFGNTREVRVRLIGWGFHGSTKNTRRTRVVRVDVDGPRNGAGTGARTPVKEYRTMTRKDKSNPRPRQCGRFYGVDPNRLIAKIGKQ